MVGNLTVDKASLNLSYFLKSINIISNHNGRVLRPEFVAEMASFMGTYATKDGKENRTPYNKLKQVQYFGFAKIEKNDEGKWLSLTRRGEILSKLISENIEETDPEKKYYIDIDKIPTVRKLFIYDLLYNSYGRNNCGAEQSNTDIEPPKVVIKLLATIGSASCDEICFAIYALNGGKEGKVNEIISWNNIISTIYFKRDKGEDYELLFEKWGIKNIVQDFKIVNLLANPSIDIIRENDKMYYLSPNIEERYISIFKSISCYYKPLLQLFNNATNTLEEVKTWVLDAVINRDENDNDLIVCDIRIDGNILQENIPHIVSYANAQPKCNAYILVIANSKEQVIKAFGPYQDLLGRVEDAKSQRNGESIKSVSGFPVQKFPANFHIVSIILNK